MMWRLENGFSFNEANLFPWPSQPNEAVNVKYTFFFLNYKHINSLPNKGIINTKGIHFYKQLVNS